MFSVHVLTYGDHPDLICRCLTSVRQSADWSLISEVVIGMNEISYRVVDYLMAFAMRCPVPVRLISESNNKNVGKYPLMRRMLAGVAADRVMWFDDDSHVTGDQSWWKRVHDKSDKCDLLGQKWRISSLGSQHLGVNAQPWCRKPRLQPKFTFDFCTGGWWVAKIAKLRQWDYPFLELHCNGGDSILGELAQQQGWTVSEIRDAAKLTQHRQKKLPDDGDLGGGVAVNRAKRRGDTSRWIWQDWVPGQVPDLSHQQFEVREVAYRKKIDLGPLPPLIKLPGM